MSARWQCGNVLLRVDRWQSRKFVSVGESTVIMRKQTKPKLFKIRSPNNAKKYGVAAVSLKELIKKGCHLLKVIVSILRDMSFKRFVLSQMYSCCHRYPSSMYRSAYTKMEQYLLKIIYKISLIIQNLFSSLKEKVGTMAVSYLFWYLVSENN